MKIKTFTHLRTLSARMKQSFLFFFLFVLSFTHVVHLYAQNSSPAIITCPADIIQNNDPGTCTTRVNFPNDTYNGDPNITVSYSKPSGAPYPVGTTRVTKQLLDQNGVPVSSCSFNVIVLDTEAPVITNCPGNLSVNNTKDSCGAIVVFTLPAVYERCTYQQKTFYYTGTATKFVVPAGVTSIDVDVTGAAGGHTYYNGSVYGNPGLGGETGGTIAVTPGQVLTINVGGAGQDASSAHAGAGGYNGGGNGAYSADDNNVITFAAGGGGGASDIRTAGGTLADRIIVAGGGGASGITDAGGNGGDITGQNGSGGTTPATGGTQTQGGTGGSYSNDFYAGNGDFGIGGKGADQTPGGGGGAGWYGGGGGSFGSGAGGSSFAYAAATNVYHVQGAHDGNGSITLSYNQPATLTQTAGLSSGSLFPAGLTTNTFTATDASGNTSTCTFTVNVTDTQSPAITAPANVLISVDSNSSSATHVPLGTPVTSDNCGIAGVTNNAPASFPEGTTTVTYTVTDTHGNTNTATQTVTVTDSILPVIKAPANITVSADSSKCSATHVALGTPVASDNSGVASVSNNAPASFPVGTTTITYTVKDNHGNSNTATQTITVTDTQKPIIKAPANVSVFAGNNSCSATNVALGTPVTSDNCGVASVTNNAPASYAAGTTTVTYTVTDIHGNSSTAVQTVTVTDNQKPVLVAPAAQTFKTTASTYIIPALVATDNCGIASVTYTVSGATARTGTGTNASGSFNPGTSVITYTVTDVHGNVQTGTTTVTLSASTLNVTIPDVYAVSPGGQPNTLYIGYGPLYLSLMAIVSDGKSPYTYAWTITGYKNVIYNAQTLPVFLPGEYTVTVTDAKGATASFKKQVLMVDVRCGSKNDRVVVCVPAKGSSKKSTVCANADDVKSLLKNGGSLGQCTTTTSAAKTSASVAESATTSTEKASAAESKLVVVDETKKLSVYPNPTSGQFDVRLKNFKASKADIEVLSQDGRIVQRRTVELTGGNYIAAFDIRNLAAGIYTVKIITGDGIQTEKVILHH